MAHENEYAGAIAGMAETYGTATNTPAVGDFVSGLTKGKRWSGHVQAIEANRMVVEVDGAWLVVSVEDITH
jgi:ribosome maturation factor RimP